MIGDIQSLRRRIGGRHNGLFADDGLTKIGLLGNPGSRRLRITNVPEICSVSLKSVWIMDSQKTSLFVWQNVLCLWAILIIA